MKKISILMMGLAMTVAASAQNKEVNIQDADTAKTKVVLADEHRFGIAARGGMASLMQQIGGSKATATDVKSNVGYEAGLDLEYTCYWSGYCKNPRLQIGLKTGVSVLYAASSVDVLNLSSAYNLYDSEGNYINYKVSASSVKENDSQLMIEIPVMFALHNGGLTFAIGPRFNIPVSGWYTLNYTAPHIQAYYPKQGVAEIDETVTGKLGTSTAKATGDKLNTAKFNLMLSTEIGYEWGLKNGDAVGLLVYGGYSIYSNYTNNSSEQFIQVGTPKAGGPQIDGNSIMNSYGSGMGYYNVGLKLVYTFRFPKK